MSRIALLAALLGAALNLYAQQVSIVVTDADLKTPMQQKAGIRFSSGPGSSSRTITVNGAQQYQTIDGFGASLTDSSAWLLYTQLTPQQRAETMRDLFDPEHGIGLNFVRQPMGASDLARSDYSYDDMPAGQADPELQHFSISHDDAYILPALRDAIKLNPHLKVMATPWSAPGWMKSSDSLIGGSLKESAYDVFAQYFVKFIQAYKGAGVPIYAITMQNEPLFEPKNYPGMRFPAEAQRKFLRDHLGPALANAQLHPHVLIYDHNWDEPEYPETILKDPDAAKYTAGVAWHCYGGDVSAQSLLHEKFPDKDVWETECSGGTWQKNNALGEEAWLMIEATRNWARSVELWNIALDQHHGPYLGGCDTCRGIVTIDTSTHPATVTRNGDYYALGHVTKFLRAGAVRVASNSFEDTNLLDVAFRNPDGSIVLVVLNNTKDEQAFSVSDAGSSFEYTLPAGSLATFRWISHSGPTS